MKKIVKGVFSLALGVAAAGVAQAYDASSYVQSGLVAQWDGIDNLGTGSHVANSVWWKDLKGGNDLVLSAKASWGENFLAFDGPSAWGRFAAPKYKTVEILFRNTSSESKIVFFSGINCGYAIGICNSGKRVLSHVNNSWQKPVNFKAFDATEDHQIAFTYGDDGKTAGAFTNGVAVTYDAAYANYSSAAFTGVVIGGGHMTTSNQQHPAYGRVYAIRLYDRVLSAEELANNAAIDRVRFFGEEDPGGLGPGEIPTPETPAETEAKTLNVSEADGDDATGSRETGAPFRNIQTAIDAAELGDTVLVRDGTYYMPVGKDHIMTIGKAITVKSVNGPESTICDCAYYSDNSSTGSKDVRGVICTADAVVDGFTFRNCKLYSRLGTPSYAAARFSAGTVRKVKIELIQRINRAGVMLIDGSTVAEDCEIVGPWNGVDAADAPSYGIQMDGRASATRVSVHGITFKNYNGVGDSANHFAGIRLQSPFALLRDSLVYGNTNATKVGTLESIATTGGIEVRAGIVENCTSTRNYSAGHGGGMWVGGYSGACRVINTLVYGNTSLGDATDVYCPDISGVFAYCSASDFAQTKDGLVATCNSYDPKLDAAFKPTAYSANALIGKAVRTPSTMAAGATDLAGQARENPSGSPDIGCYEYYPSGDEPFDVIAEVVGGVVMPGDAVTCAATLIGAKEGMTFRWDFGDGSSDTENLIVSHAYDTPGAYTVKFTVFDKNGQVAKAVEVADAAKVVGEICYVSETGANRAPYENWENAARTVADALKMGSPTVLVTNGNYMIASPYLALDRVVTLKSVNGPSVTTLYAEKKASSDCRYMLITADALVAGFTLTNSTCETRDTWHSFNMSAGTISNCVLKSMRNSNRSELCNLSGMAKMIDVEIDGRGVTFNGYDHACSAVTLSGSATLDRMNIHGFQFKSYDSKNNEHAAVILNSANAAIRNSLIHSNTNGTTMSDTFRCAAIKLTSGTVDNCTVADNFSYGSNGGLFVAGTANCHVRNSVFWGNGARIANNDVGCATLTGVFSACNASDLDQVAGGLPEGCSTADPNFDTKRPYHLSVYSTTCLDTGDPLEWITEGSLDLDGTNRVYNGVVDRGCYEFNEDSSVPLSGVLVGIDIAGRVPYDATVELTPVGDTNGLSVVWNFGDKSAAEAGGLVGRHRYVTPGPYVVSATIANEAGESTNVVATFQVRVAPPVCYVSKTGGNVFPYANWDDAATDVFTAIDVNPEKVIVGDGVWQIGGEGLIIATDCTVESLNGPAKTELHGNSHRVVWLRQEKSVLRGFTVSGGYGDGSVNDTTAFLQQDAGLVEDCVFTRPLAGCYKCPYANCKGTLRRCTLTFGQMLGNMDAHFASHPNGWKLSEGALMENCIVSNCLMGAATDGGGKSHDLGVVVAFAGSTLRNTLFYGCDTTYPPRNTDDVRHNPLLVYGNAVVENCSFVNCTAAGDGGAMAILSGAAESPVVRNCAFTGNVSVKAGGLVDVLDVNSKDAPRLTHCCSVQLSTDLATGNVGKDPQLGYRKTIARPYPKSPCVNAAERLDDWMTPDAVDVYGNPRVYGGQPDIGCCESQSGGFQLFVR